jgi:hypothetical protein
MKDPVLRLSKVGRGGLKRGKNGDMGDDMNKNLP